MSIIFIKNDEDFDPSKMGQYEQPLLPNAAKTEQTYFKHSMKLLETFKKKREIISDEEIKDTWNLFLDNQVDKDVLIFEGNFNKRLTQLVERKCVLSSKVQEIGTWRFIQAFRITWNWQWGGKKNLTTQSIWISRRDKKLLQLKFRAILFANSLNSSPFLIAIPDSSK